jgi:hypothetical protein
VADLIAHRSLPTFHVACTPNSAHQRTPPTTHRFTILLATCFETRRAQDRV